MRVKDYYDLLVWSDVKSNKFWGMSNTDIRVVEYGRIGKKPRTHIYDNREHVTRVMEGKIFKGYIYVERNDIADDHTCCEGSDTIVTRDVAEGDRGPTFHLCLGCGSRINHDDEQENFNRFINQALHRRSYGAKGDENG
jgi:predicted DNA-binding WGR domain protein